MSHSVTQQRVLLATIYIVSSPLRTKTCSSRTEISHQELQSMTDESLNNVFVVGTILTVIQASIPILYYKKRMKLQQRRCTVHNWSSTSRHLNNQSVLDVGCTKKIRLSQIHNEFTKIECFLHEGNTLHPVPSWLLLPTHIKKARILNAWNRYHTPDARNTTTFIPKFGRYRYLCSS